MDGIDLTSIQETLTQTISTYGMKLVGAIVVLVVGFMVAKIIRGAVRKALYKSKLDDMLVPFISGMIYYLMVAFVMIAALKLFGFDTTSLIAILGAAGLAVGLALQGTLSNFSAGVMLITFRPLRVGDYVDIAGTAGTVVEVGIFSTIMNTPDNVRIVVPNSKIFGETIKNYSFNDTRRNDMTVGISYADDIGVAIETIRKMLDADDRVLKDPEALIAVSEMADSSVNLIVRPWCRRVDYWGLRCDLPRRLKEELEAAGCSIPFPQHDVHLHQVTG